jgi:hypothetical protein
MHRRKSRALGAALLALVASLAVAAPAPAYLRDFQAFQVLTPSNSQTSKQLQFVCPGGKTAIGTGATIPLISNLGISGMWIFFGQRAVFERAQETDSDAARWALTARAFCATNTAVKPNVGGAAPYIKRVTIERNQSSSNSNFAKTVTATCPASAPTAIGGGGTIEGATNDVAIDSVQRGGGNLLRVKAHETDATGASWSVEAHAICADVSSAPATNVYADNVTGNHESVSGVNSLNKTITATCPAGKSVIGGAALTYSPGTGFPAPPNKVVLKASRPAGDGATTNQWTATAVEVDPTGASWQLRVRAICANLNGSFA